MNEENPVLLSHAALQQILDEHTQYMNSSGHRGRPADLSFIG